MMVIFDWWMEHNPFLFWLVIACGVVIVVSMYKVWTA
jgi:hypothetical protein